MKLKLVTEGAESEPDLTLKVTQNGNQITVETLDKDGDVEWSVVSLGVIEGQLVLVRHCSIGDKLINTNDDGRIEEADANDLEAE